MSPTDLAAWGLCFAIAAFCIGALPGLPRNENWARSLVAGLIVATAARYLLWRYTRTIPDLDAGIGTFAWAWFCLLAETAAFVELVTFMLVLSRTSNRTPEADRHQARLQAMLVDALPAVDVFIPTYNEGPEVVERSILGALSMDYPKLTVWVLDDGGRDWLREFCDRHGARYLRRTERNHAKAGNMNHALGHATGDLVAIFDADFVPRRNFLWRTVGFFDDPTIGIVQTPQHFFNRDPVQNNLSLQRCWPDEQRLFFDVMAAGRDAWNAAFCCGAGSVVRREALDAIGGFPTASITEDLLTTLAMLRKGWITRYLNERLAQGLAAETLEAFFVQRQRWCRGALQAIYLPEGPLGRGLSWFQRIMFFPFSWIIQYPVRILFLAVPAVYLWTGVTPLVPERAGETAAFLLPAMIMAFAGMRWLAPDTYMPFLSTVASVFSSFRLLPTVIAGLVRPFGVGFKVTPKGSLTAGGQVDLLTLSLLGLMGGVTAGGLAINLIPEWRILSADEFFPYASGWAMLNLSIVLVASLLCFEAKRHRNEERFPAQDAASLLADDIRRPCRILDLSLAGARVAVEGGLPDEITLDLPEVGRLQCRIVRRGSDFICVNFSGPGDDELAGLVRSIYGAGRSNAVDHLEPTEVVRSLLVRLAS
ncbi:glycosyltransferase [Magnetospirillum sp. SS-4]|uniref:glycosyltransferase n=1 Tax=Magnetospirillum sp. SS-4 TaxID=2681465 RepID=UPI001382D318|nr:glycosyltransferase [Magnetospirillum sp. SS-4]CAA7621919.1 putative cellulose synthase catalytic subunit protein [Magnetospirillum sp. SS-4]